MLIVVLTISTKELLKQLFGHKMSSEELIDLMGKGPATRYVLYKGLSDN